MSYFSLDRRRRYVNANSERTTELPLQSLTFDFESVFLNQYSRIVGVIGRIVGDSGRAEDLAVEVFWKLLRKPRRKTSDPGGWLYRTAVRTGLDELRKQSRREKYERMFSFTRVTPTPEQLYSENEKQQRVRRVLASISSRCAELLILRSDGLNYQELAQALELSPQAFTAAQALPIRGRAARAQSTPSGIPFWQL